jgi:hypothetical protein
MKRNAIGYYSKNLFGELTLEADKPMNNIQSAFR